MSIGALDERRRIASSYAPETEGGTSATHATGRKPPRDAVAEGVFARLDAAFGADLAAFAANASAPRQNGGVLYIGFNGESETKEVEALAKEGGVRVLTDKAEANDVSINGTKYDFTKPGEIDAFVDKLALDPRVASAVKDALAKAEPTSRAKLAQIAAVFAEAEKGTPIPSRLVISGHSGGLDIFGGNGELAIADLQRLAHAMPRAAACIEDIHLSACSTSAQAGLDDARAAWTAAFPNLKTMWAYAGSSSMAPAEHLRTWARSTAKPHDAVDVPEKLRAQHVATWNARDGYRDGLKLPDLRRAQHQADPRFSNFLSGKTTASSDPQSALHDYETYRVLSSRSDVPTAERNVFTRRADQLLRVRYYDQGVRQEFAKRHGAEAAAAFRAAGLPVPSFDTLSRKDALAKIAELEGRVARMTTVPSEISAALGALRGLRDLDRKIIPDSDCHH